MANRDLLKEAIADAKAVKETAIANAKAALEEAFSPMLREKLAAKIAEIDEMEEEVDLNEADMEDLEDTDVEEGKTKSLDGYGKVKNVNDYSDDKPVGKIAKTGTDDGSETEVNEVDLEELLRELDELEEDGFGKFSSDGTEGFSAEEEGETPMKALDETEGEEEFEDSDADGIEDSEDEEIDLENMSEDDLKNFIEGVIADMVANGELEGGHEGMENEEGEESEEGEEGEESKELEMMAEVKKMKKEKEEAKKEAEKAKKELKEALETISTIKTELQEVNLFNAKLLYTNKIFKSKNLTESQKVKVLAAFDKAASVKEAKLVYETLSSGVAKTAAKPMNESLIKGGASKPAGVAEKKPIMEANDQVARWQKLAGIK
jgi:hypothetical protein